MSRGITTFTPERLLQALSARGLSQTQLATMVGVSSATISKWKNGTQTPPADMLERLAQVVNVSSEWFTRPIQGLSTNQLYRSQASALKGARSLLQTRLDWGIEITQLLQTYVDYPELNLPKRVYTDPAGIAQEDIEEAAEECRQLWGLGHTPIQDLALAVESAGIILFREETGISQIEGLSGWDCKFERPYILLSADKENGYRSRFDLAHELGHLVLHKHINEVARIKQHKLMEDQAHAFAGALLLPAKGFLNEVKLPVTLDTLLPAKVRWGISVAAIIMRLYSLGLISDQEKGNLFKRRSARWGVKSEPRDETRNPEKPRLLKRAIDLLVSEGVLTLDSVPRYLGLSETDIKMLVGLPENYFLGGAKVVNLATLRAQAPDDRRIMPGQGTSREVAFINEFRRGKK